jgi:hypothetical protein
MKAVHLPPSDPIVIKGFTWWSKGDLMAWNPEGQVERYKRETKQDYDWKLVEVWKLND